MKYKFELNLNNIIFLLSIIVVSIWGTRQFFEKRRLQKEISSNIEEFNDYKSQLNKSEQKLVDSVVYYKSEIDLLIEKNKAYKKQIEYHKQVLIDSIYKLSINESKLFIDSVYSKKEGDTINIRETQLKDIHITTLKLKECETLSNFQQKTIEELDKAYSNCSSSVEVLKENLSECSESNKKNTIKIKSLRKKVWSNRIIGIAGISIAILAVI